MDEENPPPHNNNSNNNPPPLNRPYRIRRSSSSTISSTTSPAFPTPQNPLMAHRGGSRLAASLHSSLSNSSSRSSNANHHNGNHHLNNNQNAHVDLDEDQPSSSTAFMPPSPSPHRSLRPHLNSNVAGTSNANGRNLPNSNSGPVSPLGSPDSTYWGPAPSPINNYHRQGGPATPGGMCVVSSSTVDDVPPSPLQFSSDNENISVSVGVLNSVSNNNSNTNNNVMLPPLPVASGPSASTTHSQSSSSGSNTSSSSSNIVSLRNNGRSLNSGLILNLNSSSSIDSPPASISVASSSNSSSSTSTSVNNNISHNHLNAHVNVIATAQQQQQQRSTIASNNDLNFSLNPIRSKIKKASSFERFSLQQAASASSSSHNSNSSSSTSSSHANPTSISSQNPPNQCNSNDITGTSHSFTSSSSSSSAVATATSGSSTGNGAGTSAGTGSRLLWDSLLSAQNSSSSSSSSTGTQASAASSSSSSSTLRQIFTASNNGLISGDLKSLHIKIPSKKLAAKIASVFEQEEQQQQLLLQQQQNDLMMNNLINQSQGQSHQPHQNSNSISIPSSNSNNNSSIGNASGLLGEDSVAGINLIGDVNEPIADDHENLIRELQISESPLNLTENNSSSNNNNGANAASSSSSSSSRNARNFMTTTTVTTTTTTAIAIPTKKIPLTPKQKLLHRMQSGELLTLSPPPPVQQQQGSPLILPASQNLNPNPNPNQLLQQQLNQPPHNQNQNQNQCLQQQSSLAFQHQQSLSLVDNLQQSHSHSQSPPPQLVDPYVYESLLRNRDDFIVQDNLGLSKGGLDGDASGVGGVLYDPDAYSYYYGTMLGEEIFSTTSTALTSGGVGPNGGGGSSSSVGASSIQNGSLSSGISSRPLLMLPQSSASLQDDHDGHGNVEFMLGMEDTDPDHDPHNTLSAVRGSIRDEVDHSHGHGHEHDHDHDVQLGPGPNGSHGGNVNINGSPNEFKSPDSTLRNLLTMPPMQSHEDTWFSSTDYQSQIQGSSNGNSRLSLGIGSSGLGRQSLSSNNQVNVSLGGVGMAMSGGSGGSSSVLQNALNLNINLNNPWMTLTNDWSRNSWPHSMSMIGMASQQDEQDEVMDMSVMDSPDKHTSGKRHVNHLDHDHDQDQDQMDDMDLVEASGLPLLTSMQMPMDLQLQVPQGPMGGIMTSTNGSLNSLGVSNSVLSLHGGSSNGSLLQSSSSAGSASTISMMSAKGQQILVHDSGALESSPGPGGSDPLNLHQRHRCDDDEPVNLISAVSLDNDVSLHHQSHLQHQHSHHNPIQQNHGHHGQQQHHQLTQEDLDHLPNSVTVLQHSSILSSHQQQQLSNSRHINHTIESNKQQSQQMQCGGYITLHAATPQGNEYHHATLNSDNSCSHSSGQSSNLNLASAGVSSIHLAENSNPNDSINGNDVNDNIDERRIIRVKKVKEVVTSISGHHGHGAIFLSGALSPESVSISTTASLNGTNSSKTSAGGVGVASIILDKPIQPKSFASLPTPLHLNHVPGDDCAVFTARHKTIAVNTRFGPVEGPLKRAFKEDLNNLNTEYPCLFMLDGSSNLWQLDRTDDELCNWMKFVRMAKNPNEQNAVITEDRGLLYFSTTKDIPPKTELLVGYSLEYVQKYGLPYYTTGNSRSSSICIEQMNDISASASPISMDHHHQQQQEGQGSVSVSVSGSIATDDNVNNSDNFASISMPGHSLSQDDENLTTLSGSGNDDGNDSKSDEHRHTREAEIPTSQSQSQNENLIATNGTNNTLSASSSNSNAEYIELYNCFECQDNFTSVEELKDHLENSHREPDTNVVRKPKKRNAKKSKILNSRKEDIFNNDTQTPSEAKNKLSNVFNGTTTITKTLVGSSNTSSSGDAISVVSYKHGNGFDQIKKGKYECNTCKAIVPTLVDLTKHAAQHYDDQSVIFVDNSNEIELDQGQDHGEVVVTSGAEQRLQYKSKQAKTGSSSNLKNDHHQKLIGSSNSNSNVLKTVLTSMGQSNIIKSSSNGTETLVVTPDCGMAPSTKVKCTMCYKSFATKDRLDKHMIVHSDEETKPLKCEFCPKRFLTNSALAGHIKTHAEEGKCFECPMCEFVTQQLLQLKEHVQTHKNKENGMFYCPKCSKKFSMYSMVRKHIRAFHGPRQFGCDQCTMSFPTSDKLKLHKLKHSDHREFLCAECGRQFKRKDKLREHAKRMHENRKKPIDIHQLPGHLTVGGKNRNAKKFVPKTSPEEFEKFVYKCSDCMMGFKRRGMLVNHLAKRHPEKPPQQVPELNMPILRPTRNYFCPYCDRVYKSSSKRKSHILKSHPGQQVPPQLKGKESVTVNDGAKLITVSVNSVLSSTNDLKMMVSDNHISSSVSNGIKVSSLRESNKSKPTESDSNGNGSQIFPVSNIVPDKRTSSSGNGNGSEQEQSLNQPQKQLQQPPHSQQQYREVSVVGKVMANPHSCQWCHRQYATRAKLLQHQRKSHLHLMPPDMQLPRTQKNNVVRIASTASSHNESTKGSVSTTNPSNSSKINSTNYISKTGNIVNHNNNNNRGESHTGKNDLLSENTLPSSSTTALPSITPDSSNNSNNNSNRSNIAVDSSSSSTNSGHQQASSTTTTTIALNEQQLQQLQLHHHQLHSGGDETGSVIGFLLTTTTVNANGEIGSLVPSEIVVVPVQASQLQQNQQQSVSASSQILSAATANAMIQQAVLSTTTGISGSACLVGQNSTTNLPLTNNNSNIRSNVISSAVAGINIVNPIVHQTD